MKTEKTTNYFRIFLLFLLSIALSTTFYSCEGDEESGGGCEDELATLANTLTAKSEVYSSNPTGSNCNGVRTAALNLINRATACGYGSLYVNQTDFWLNLDCSDNGGGGTGGGGTGGGGTGGSNGNVTFWIQSDLGCGNISVSLNGFGGTISSFYSASPNCGASGCANFTLPAGNYSYSASCSGKTWSGTVNVTAGGCFKMRLTN